MNKTIISLILILLMLPIANAITGSIGNAKAIINVNVESGKTTVIERTILVKNVNNVSVNITLEPDENLKPIIELIDGKFVLQPQEEKKARFNLNIERPGNYSGRIAVFFAPSNNKGAGVVLSSSITVHATGEGDFPVEETPAENTTVENNTPEEQPVEENKTDTGVKISIGGSKETTTQKDNTNLIFIIIMIIILLLIIGGAIYFLRKW